MSRTITAKRIGIVAVNHTGYVEAVLNHLADGNTVVSMRSLEDCERINAASVDQVITSHPGKNWMQPCLTPIASDEIALIAFTSGTEGTPKGVLISHKNLSDVVYRLNSLMQLDNSISEYIGVPVYHSFGFGRCRAIAMAGGRFFIPENGFNPAEIAALLKRGEINAISAVPSLWRVLLDNQDLIGSYGRRVRWIEIGSQYMSRSEKEALISLFPEARIVQHYGLTEASRSTLLEIHQTTGDYLDSVGKTIGSVEIKTTPEGKIAIRGEHVAQGYLINGQVTPLKDQDGWFLTNDLGTLQKGHLYYHGRADDVINCGGLKVHPEALETKIYQQVGYSQDIAVCRKKDPLRGESFLLAVTRDSQHDLKKLQQAAMQATQELGVNAGNAITLIEVESLPKTATGKIQRRQLSSWYEQQINQESQVISQSKATQPKSLREIFARLLVVPEIRPEDTFISLGGDSLSYVQASIELERCLGYVPLDWEQMSFDSLESLSPERKSYTTIETNVLLRALSICGVVANHAMLIPSGFIGGGSLLLLAIAGLNFARFQSESLLRGQVLKPVFLLLRNVLIPYWVITGAYQLWTGEFYPSILLLTSNFISSDVQGIFPVWFIQVLAQSVLLFSAVFWIPGVPKIAHQSPWRFGLLNLGIGVLATILIPFVWDTSYLNNNVPNEMFWIFALGYCIHYTRSRFKRTVLTLLTLAVTLALFLHPITDWLLSEMIWIFAGSIILLNIPYMIIPVWIKQPLQILSAAAYYVYLTHIAFIYFVTQGAGIDNPWIKTTIAVFGGVFTWWTTETLKQVKFGVRQMNARHQN
jgi:acyl-CoA synthetase (AMP-forming)/AMP-acid ligase II/acyl carrier protein